MAGGSRERIEGVVSELLGRWGYNGMGLKAVSDGTGLPYGSIYHHFPGGKEEIAAAAITGVGDALGGFFRSLFAEGVRDDAVRALFEFMAGRLEGSGWLDGCPIGTPAQDGAVESDAVREACWSALAQMIDAIADALVRDGVDPAAAGELAVTIVAAYEGATTLARVQRSAAPLRAAGEAMVHLVRAAAPPSS